MKKRAGKTFMIIIIISFFAIIAIIFSKYDTKIDEFIDEDTGVVYLKSGSSLTPKLDKEGKVIVKKK